MGLNTVLRYRAACDCITKGRIFISKGTGLEIAHSGLREYLAEFICSAHKRGNGGKDVILCNHCQSPQLIAAYIILIKLSLVTQIYRNQTFSQPDTGRKTDNSAK